MSSPQNLYQQSQVVSISTQAHGSFCHYPQDMMVLLSQYFQSLQVLNLITHISCQKICKRKLLSKNQQTLNNTTIRKENKNNIQNSKQVGHRSILKKFRNDMSDEQQRLNKIKQQQGAFTWFTTLPIKEEGYTIKRTAFGTYCH